MALHCFDIHTKETSCDFFKTTVLCVNPRKLPLASSQLLILCKPVWLYVNFLSMCSDASITACSAVIIKRGWGVEIFFVAD